MVNLTDFIEWLAVEDKKRAALVLRHAREFEKVHRLVTRELIKSKASGSGISTSNLGNGTSSRRVDRRAITSSLTSSATGAAFDSWASRNGGQHRAGSFLHPRSQNTRGTVGGQALRQPSGMVDAYFTYRGPRSAGGTLSSRGNTVHGGKGPKQSFRMHDDADHDPVPGRNLSWPSSVGGGIQRRSSSNSLHDKSTASATAKRLTPRPANVAVSVASASSSLHGYRPASVSAVSDCSMLELGLERWAFGSRSGRSRRPTTSRSSSSSAKHALGSDYGYGDRHDRVDLRNVTPDLSPEKKSPLALNMSNGRSTWTNIHAGTAASTLTARTAAARTAAKRADGTGAGMTTAKPARAATSKAKRGRRGSANPRQNFPHNSVHEAVLSRSSPHIPEDAKKAGSDAASSRSHAERRQLPRGGSGGNDCGDYGGPEGARCRRGGDERLDGAPSSCFTDFFASTTPSFHKGSVGIDDSANRREDALQFSGTSSLELQRPKTMRRPPLQQRNRQHGRSPSASLSRNLSDLYGDDEGVVNNAERGAKEALDRSGRRGSSTSLSAMDEGRGAAGGGERGRKGDTQQKVESRYKKASTSRPLGGRAMASKQSPKAIGREVGEHWLRMRDPVSHRQFYFDPETRAAEWEDGGAMNTPEGMGLGLLSAEEREKLRRKFERRQRKFSRGARERPHQPGLREQVLRKMAREGNDGSGGGEEEELQSLPEEGD